jgi:hypothetical protein
MLQHLQHPGRVACSRPNVGHGAELRLALIKKMDKDTQGAVVDDRLVPLHSKHGRRLDGGRKQKDIQHTAPNTLFG